MRIPLLFAVLTLAACTLPTGRQAPQTQPAVPSEETSSVAASSSPLDTYQPPETKTLEGTEYRNDAHGFAVTVPAGSTVRETAYSVRIQNYSWEDERMGLASGEYYLEISFDGEGQLPCEDAVLDGVPVTVGDMAGYRGLGHEGGDPGGKRFALCLERGGYFYVMATENSDEGKIANAILDSFRLL